MSRLAEIDRLLKGYADALSRVEEAVCQLREMRSLLDSGRYSTPIEVKKELVLEQVCQEFGISLGEFWKNIQSRRRKYVELRMVFCWAVCMVAEYKREDIGEYLGKDHTTITNCVKRAREYADTNRDFSMKLNRVINRLQKNSN